MKIWEWLNGKKTNIGAAATAVYALAKACGLKVDAATDQTVLTVIGVVCGVGLGHKVVKSASEGEAK